MTLATRTLAERLSAFTRTGHRGARGLAPENTLLGFQRAVELGVDMLELDVRLSKDGEVVVLHDALLDRTTDALGPVAERTYAELERLDAGHAFARDGGFPFRGQGARIPRLVDVLDAFPDVMVTVEVKPGDPALVPRAVALVRERAPERVVLASADHATIRALRAHAPELPRRSCRRASPAARCATCTCSRASASRAGCSARRRRSCRRPSGRTTTTTAACG
jgi:glycerophosphoryl diester phosphodiesterase